MIRWLALAFLLVAGCAGEPARRDESRPPTDACGHMASFVAPGLYDTLANASAGEFTHEQWAKPSLPYENATLRERWRDYSLFGIGRDLGTVADHPTQLGVRAREGGLLEIYGNAEANVTAATMRQHFLDFAREIVEDPVGAERWADAFLATKAPSAYRDEGPIYGYTYDVTIGMRPRIQAFLDELPSFDAWAREPDTTRHGSDAHRVPPRQLERVVRAAHEHPGTRRRPHRRASHG